MEAVERYTQVRRELMSMVSTREIANIFQSSQPVIRRSIEIMVKHLDSIIAGRTPTVAEEEKKAVVSAAIRLLDTLITSRVTPALKKFARLWVELCNNWNTQVGFVSELKTINNTLCLLTDIAVTLEDLVCSAAWIMREIKMLSSLKPSGVVLAENYIRYIYENLKNKEEVTRNDKS